MGKPPLTTELWSICHGLELAWDLRAPQVILESDSLDAINCVLYPDPRHPQSNIISPVSELRQRPWQLFMRHVMREANQCADFLAHMDISHTSRISILDHPSNDLPILLLDMNGRSCDRAAYSYCFC